MTKLASKLPQGDRNGLGDIASALVATPHTKHFLLAVVDCSRITLDPDTGDNEPTVRILRIEAVSKDDFETAERLIRRALERRSGTTVLPYQQEKELDDLFAEIRIDEPEVGE